MPSNRARYPQSGHNYSDMDLFGSDPDGVQRIAPIGTAVDVVTNLQRLRLYAFAGQKGLSKAGKSEVRSRLQQAALEALVERKLQRGYRIFREEQARVTAMCAPVSV